MNADNEDFFGEDLPDTTDAASNTAKVIATFKELMDATEQADQCNEILSGLSAKISKIKTETFPELLREMGTEIWRDPDTGITVELETAVNSSLPKDREKRNEVLRALKPLGIEEIMGEEYNVVFIPGDARSPILRRLLGIPEPIDNLLEEEGAEDKPVLRLTNEQIDAIEAFREAFKIGTMPAEEKLGVHASRLASWLKKKIEGGFGTQVRDAGIWHGKSAKVNKPKKKAGAS